ncbi:hypothetical protein [Phyllobacterium lublinensis]|uniref:hypothetical protein n=1 Tax=Phyllobacterium lublinensis TaxID=2875708 RepID=UPI001CC99E57|nr:hypothetical protein [Phyllobacterium sp. 2063]MBZ9655039.1 hypothetical protein [Phyllobacterium sp. 2063]
MKRFTDAGRACIEAGNLYAGLSLALMMPDICASLEDPGPGKSQKRYVRWCQQWLEPKLSSTNPRTGEVRVLVTAEDCYQIRCSLVHSGSADIDPRKAKDIGRFEFFDQTVGSHLNWIGSNTVNGVEQGGFLQLKADRFSLTIFDCADEWDASVVGDASIQKEKASLISIKSKGAILGGGLIRIG